MAAALGCAAVLLRDFTGVLSLCRDTLDQISVFSGTLQPVLATVLATGGNTATATVLQAATMVVFDLVIRLVNALLVPAACAYLAITAGGCRGRQRHAARHRRRHKIPDFGCA